MEAACDDKQEGKQKDIPGGPGVEIRLEVQEMRAPALVRVDKGSQTFWKEAYAISFINLEEGSS